MIPIIPYQNPFETIRELRAELAEAKRRGYEQGVRDASKACLNVGVTYPSQPVQHACFLAIERLLEKP